MPRLFVGLEVPHAIAMNLERLRCGFPGPRWVDTQNYHITLSFICGIDNGRAHHVDAMR